MLMGFFSTALQMDGPAYSQTRLPQEDRKMEKPTEGSLTQQSTRRPVVSLREQSASTIQAAILSPRDEGAVLTRTNAVLALYYDPDLEPETKAAIREEFVRALSTYPIWAVHKAFDNWTRTATRRPTPGEIVILVAREVQPLSDELTRRAKEATERREYKPEPTPEEMERRRIFAQGVMQNMGYAKAADRPKGPVRETVTDEDRAEMAAHLAAKFGEQP